MKEIFVEDYNTVVEFPDETSNATIESSLRKKFPETDEKLVARFENPDTPSSSLTREDFVRYKAVKPEMQWSEFPGLVAQAAGVTVQRIAENLPAAIGTYLNIFDPGTSARTFMEGAARGAYDTEILGRMANDYLGSKLDSFGGTSENETTDQFNNFLKLKELQNVRGGIERGEESAWNEYAEFAGLDAAKIDLEKVDTKAAELTGEFIDPSLLIPAGKVGTIAAKGITKGLSTPTIAMGKGLSRAADLSRDAIERGKNIVKGASETIDEATGGLANVAVPGGIGAAVASGIVGAGTAKTFGTVLAAPTILDVSGGLLRGFGEAMSSSPTRTGGLGRLALHQPDTVAGKLAGRLKWLDKPVEYAGRATAGAAVGAGIGGAIGLASGGLEGLAQGIGSGGVLGAFGGGVGRAAEGLTGSALRRAQDNDFNQWIETKTPEDRVRLEKLSREDKIARMDAEQILLQSSVEVRHVDPDFVVDEAKGTKMGEASGMMRIEAGKPVVFLNTNAGTRTMLHETLHALGRLDGFDTLVSNVKNTFQRMYSAEEMNNFIQQYEKRLDSEIGIDPQRAQKLKDAGSTDAKVDYILEELAAEYFANYITGKNSNYIFSGNSFSESLKGAFSRFTKGKLDRVYDAFQSPIFDQQIKQSRQLDRAMKDLVKARKKAGRDVEASLDEPVKVYSDADLADDATFAELEAMGVAKTDAKGKRFIMKDAEQKRVAKERATTIGGILDNVSDSEGGLIKQPDGSYKGTRFSAGQLKALLDSPLINDTIKEALRQLDKVSRSDQYANFTYGASTMKTKLGKTRARNLPISNRNGLMYDIVISPKTGTIAGRILDMSTTETRASRLYRESGEMQKVFGSEANMFADLHTYINALTAGEKRTAEILGSQRKSDFLNKILAIRNVKGNPEIPQVELTPRQRKLQEGKQDHPWRSFRLDRIVAMQQKEGRPVMSFSEAAYQRGQTHFMPDVDQYGYRMAHRAPDGTYDEGSIDKMDTVYPKDIYSANGARYYGNDDFESKKTIQLFRSLRGKPEAELTIYRAVPKGVSEVINPGDWVTPSKQYAELHANYFDETGAVILEKKVKAKEVYSEGNSIFEFGWNPKAPGDARFSPGTGRSKTDQDYLKAAKAKVKDYDKLQDIVNQNAENAGYTIGPVYHGTKRQFNEFKSERDPNKLIYLSFDKQFSKEYVRGFSGHRKPDPAVMKRIDEADDASTRLFKSELDALTEKYGADYAIPSSSMQSAINKSKNLERSMLDGMTATQARSEMGIRVINSFLKADKVFDPKDGWSEFSDTISNHFGVSNINELDPRVLKMLNEGDYIAWESSRIIDEVFKKYDAIRLAEEPGGPSNTIAVRDPERIKSADPITYEDDGSIIPPSERFKDTTADIRFSPEPDSPAEVRKQMQEPVESGTPMNGVFTLTPDVIARFSPAVNDPGVNLEQLNGKKVFFMFADRMLVGDYVTRSGRVFKLRGGPDHPDLADNQGKLAWAVEGGAVGPRLDRAIRMTDGIGIVVLQDELAVASNKDYSEVMMEELKFDMENNPAVKRDLKELLEDMSAAIRQTIKKNRLSKDSREKKAAEKAGKKFTASKPKKWEKIEIKSLKDLESVFPEMPFEVRKTMWQKFASKKYKDKYGGIFWKDVAEGMSAYREKDGYRTGDVVKAIQFDQSGPSSIVDPRDLGLPIHPSYRFGVLGKSISNIRGRLSVFDILRKQFESRVDPVTGEPKLDQRISKEGDVGKSSFRTLSMRSLTDPDFQPKIGPKTLDPRTYKSPVKQKFKGGVARVKAMEKARKDANKFSPAMDPLPASAETQRSDVTSRSYEKFSGMIDDEVTVLDAGAGEGAGSRIMRKGNRTVDTLEPFPYGPSGDNRANWKDDQSPTYLAMDEVPSGSYDVISSFSVVNVLKPEQRTDLIQGIGRALKPGGKAHIKSRTPGDVRAAKSKKSAGEKNAYLVKQKSGDYAYQVGFTQGGLKSEIQNTLGDGFTVESGKGLAGSYVVVTKSGTGSGGAKFSPAMMDAEYAKAIQSGDTETARRLVDDAAREAGYDTEQIAYHGTDKNFDKFDVSDSVGIWTGTESVASLFARLKSFRSKRSPRVIKAYVKSNNPASNIDLGLKVRGEEAVKQREMLKAKGFDSIIKDGKYLILFDPNQIKSADLKTYDDTGNLIPLSQRFNSQSDDIRFSPARSLNNRGGAVYNTPEGHRAVQTSSRAGVRVYGPTGRRIGPVFGSVEAAERYLSK